jgi:lipopolysaccharide/colanic/teichoic acid biosynthesis glycosyltransferase
MSTLKLGLLPGMKPLAEEDDVVAAFEQRLQFPVVQEATFIQMLRLERRRTERSGRCFMLVLIEAERFHRELRVALLQRVAAEVSGCTRETDVLGWYKRDATLGLLMTEITCLDAGTFDLLTTKISEAVQRASGAELYGRLNVIFRVFPQPATDIHSDTSDSILYPDLAGKHGLSKRGLAIKRAMDIGGSLVAIVLSAPIFAVVALLIKLTSDGPILFCQKRVGQYGREFKFLKFRTMYVDNDPLIHQEYVSKLISGRGDSQQKNGMYKLANDPRITPLGRFLRKSSIDELPQLLNVLAGQMSLIGPRPPLPYEYGQYQAWHRRRVTELKPGMTGLWQVHGRSRTTFDEMVRMDLKYAQTISLWLDIKLLLQTPRAVFSGRGAC